jgi:hypothetical protein
LPYPALFLIGLLHQLSPLVLNSTIPHLYENKVLKDSLENIEKQHIKELSRQKQKSEKLETDLSSLQSELTDRQAVFDTNVELFLF